MSTLLCPSSFCCSLTSRHPINSDWIGGLYPKLTFSSSFSQRLAWMSPENYLVPHSNKIGFISNLPGRNIFRLLRLWPTLLAAGMLYVITPDECDTFTILYHPPRHSTSQPFSFADVVVSFFVTLLWVCVCWMKRLSPFIALELSESLSRVLPWTGYRSSVISSRTEIL